jgi:uncharacterized metal-binding protein
VTEASKEVLLVPCSGIGKVHGLIAREAVYQAAQVLAPEACRTICLALLVTEDEEALATVRSRPSIAIDGCPKLCAQKNLELAGGEVVEAVRVVDAFRDHKGAQPGTATRLEADGWLIADEIAERLATQARRLTAKEVQ